jgi:hypothetical protein
MKKGLFIFGVASVFSLALLSCDKEDEVEADVQNIEQTDSDSLGIDLYVDSLAGLLDTTEISSDSVKSIKDTLNGDHQDHDNHKPDHVDYHYYDENGNLIDVRDTDKVVPDNDQNEKPDHVDYHYYDENGNLTDGRDTHTDDPIYIEDYYFDKPDHVDYDLGDEYYDHVDSDNNNKPAEDLYNDYLDEKVNIGADDKELSDLASENGVADEDIEDAQDAFTNGDKDQLEDLAGKYGVDKNITDSLLNIYTF